MYVNGKMIPVETVSGMEEGRTKGNDEEGNFRYDTFDML
jgi:hypothetical protein